MKKIIIGVSCAVLLAAAGLVYDRTKSAAADNISNTAYVDETGFYTGYAEVGGYDENAETINLDITDFTVSEFSDPDETPANRILALENVISQEIMQAEWVDTAEVSVAVLDLQLDDSGNDLSETLVSVAVTKNRAPEEDEIDGIIRIVINSLEGVKPENIFITDEAGNDLN
ncbi:MAG: hypothetical protein K2N72_07915 [Oscillospiraceae bacterium]|nr:hypothetical protein [Oscillospiraceae bacterium]